MSISVETVVDDVAVIARSVLVAALVVESLASQGMIPQMRRYHIPMSKRSKNFKKTRSDVA